MLRITKLVPVGDGLGVVLDIPPTSKEGDTVTIYSADELAAALRRERLRCAEECRDLIDTWAKTDREKFALEYAVSTIEKL